jgi:hypothetical protein
MGRRAIFLLRAGLAVVGVGRDPRPATSSDDMRTQDVPTPALDRDTRADTEHLSARVVDVRLQPAVRVTVPQKATRTRACAGGVPVTRGEWHRRGEARPALALGGGRGRAAQGGRAPRLQYRRARLRPRPLDTARRAGRPHRLRGVPLHRGTHLRLLVSSAPPFVLDVDSGRIIRIKGINVRGNPIVSVAPVGQDAIVLVDRRGPSSKASPNSELYLVRHGQLRATRIGSGWEVAPTAGGLQQGE